MKKTKPRDLNAALKSRPLVVAGVYDCLSALLAEDAGYGAIYLSGGGLSVAFLGQPDIGLLTLNDVVEATRRIKSVTSVPLIVDADTGFGGPANVSRTIRELEKAGASAVQIEDQSFPKRCGHLAGKSLVSTEEMVEKIRIAVRARRDKRFLIVARTDAGGVNGLNDAMARAKAYKRAGADIIFPEALQSTAEFAAFGQNKALGLLMANMTEFGRSPALKVDELARLGYRLVLYPMTAFRVAAFAIRQALIDLKHDGTSSSWLDRMQSRKDLYKLIRYADFETDSLPKDKLERSRK